mgnify:CR=1 FL=1
MPTDDLPADDVLIDGLFAYNDFEKDCEGVVADDGDDVDGIVDVLDSDDVLDGDDILDGDDVFDGECRRWVAPLDGEGAGPTAASVRLFFLLLLTRAVCLVLAILALCPQPSVSSS